MDLDLWIIFVLKYFVAGYDACLQRFCFVVVVVVVVVIVVVLFSYRITKETRPSTLCI